MRRLSLALAVIVTPIIGNAETPNALIEDIVNGHILPRFEALVDTTQALSGAAAVDCDPASDVLRAAYGDAFDAWVSASHLRFGPTEVDDRAFALAFWPDSRGATPRSLAALLADSDPVIASPNDYAQVSIAARGFYAMEFLLYDSALQNMGDLNDQCTLIQTVAIDIAATSTAILIDWQTDHATRLLNPSPDGLYRSDEEVLQELFQALSTGLQFTSETRLGRPLGTFERPRPNRAEVWRSGRSTHHVALSLAALNDLAVRLSRKDQDLSERMSKSVDRAVTFLTELDDPIFASVADPFSRLKIEVVQQTIDNTRKIVRQELGPVLGVAAGFNALDGD